MKKLFITTLIALTSLSSQAALVDTYLEKMNSVSCSKSKVSEAVKENMREEFHTLKRIEGNKIKLKSMEGLLEEASMIAKVQTALTLGPVVGVAGFAALGKVYAGSYFSLGFLVDASLMAETAYKTAATTFMALGYLPTYFLSDDVVLSKLEEDDKKSQYADAREFLTHLAVQIELDKKLAELEETQPEIIVKEESVVNELLEDHVYWKKSLRYEEIINNISVQQELLTQKLQLLEVQRGVLDLICSE
jgi:hypothetical protein